MATPEVSITITTPMAIEACDRGLNHLQVAAERFKIEHNLIFDPQEFTSKENFEYYESADGEYFKIVYKGGCVINTSMTEEQIQNEERKAEAIVGNRYDVRLPRPPRSGDVW